MTHPNAHSIVSRFVEFLSALNVDGMASCLSDDIVLELPAAPAGMPREVVGLAGFHAFFDPVAQLWDQFELVDVSLHPSAHDPGTVFLEYRSAASNGRGMSYENTYLGKATVDGGKIVRYREMFDAAPAAALVAQLAAQA